MTPNYVKSVLKTVLTNRFVQHIQLSQKYYHTANTLYATITWAATLHTNTQIHKKLFLILTN